MCIKEGCTAYLQEYVIGEPVPQRAIIGGLLTNGDTVFVGFYQTLNQPIGVLYPGYYIEGADHIQGAYHAATSSTHILVIM